MVKLSAVTVTITSLTSLPLLSTTMGPLTLQTLSVNPIARRHSHHQKVTMSDADAKSVNVSFFTRTAWLERDAAVDLCECESMETRIILGFGSFLKIPFYLFVIFKSVQSRQCGAFRCKIKHLRNVSSNSTYDKLKHVTEKTSGTQQECFIYTKHPKTWKAYWTIMVYIFAFFFFLIDAPVSPAEVRGPRSPHGYLLNLSGNHSLLQWSECLNPHAQCTSDPVQQAHLWYGADFGRFFSYAKCISNFNKQPFDINTTSPEHNNTCVKTHRRENKYHDIFWLTVSRACSLKINTIFIIGSW